MCLFCQKWNNEPKLAGTAPPGKRQHTMQGIRREASKDEVTQLSLVSHMYSCHLSSGGKHSLVPRPSTLPVFDC